MPDPPAVSAPLETVDVITIAQGDDEAHIEFCVGDITAPGPQHAADVLVVSAFPDDYRPSPGSLMAALDRKGVSVAALARDKEVDLRQAFSCWMSRELAASPSMNYRRIVCFEPYWRGTPAELIGDIFRSLAPFVGGEPRVRTVTTSLVTSNYQGTPPADALVLLVEAAAHWMSIGLPLSRLQIGCPPGGPVAELRKVFAELKSRLATVTQGDDTGYEYDIFVSYAHDNSEEAMWFISELQKRAADLRLFVDRMVLDPGASWQREIYEALDDCRTVLALYSPSYIASKVCVEEYNIALCRHRESQERVLAPVYLYSAEMPTYMKLVQYWDCREFDRKASERAVTELLATVQR